MWQFRDICLSLQGVNLKQQLWDIWAVLIDLSDDNLMRAICVHTANTF